MVQFVKDSSRIILSYYPEYAAEENWLSTAIKERNEVRLYKTFNLTKGLIVENNANREEIIRDEFSEPEAIYFLFANLRTNNYFQIVPGILTKKLRIYFSEEILLKKEHFIVDSDTSIFRIIESVTDNDIYIGGENPTSISLVEYENLLKHFPNAYEKKKYTEARVASIIKNYLEHVIDASAKFESYLNKKESRVGANLLKTFQEPELVKYETILDKLSKMLKEENAYNENQWREEILQIVLLLYPKYLFAFKEVPIRAKNSEGIHERFLDLLLVDSCGNTDIIEIKKPFQNAIMTESLYRNNYIPLRELSGTVMQIEKYIYYLNRWSTEGEEFLTNKYKDVLPSNFDIKITNPGGIIIMGRENNLSHEQKRDFEVIKRKYKHIIDVITYDNLIERLKFTIEQIRKI